MKRIRDILGDFAFVIWHGAERTAVAGVDPACMGVGPTPASRQWYEQGPAIGWALEGVALLWLFRSDHQPAGLLGREKRSSIYSASGRQHAVAASVRHWSMLRCARRRPTGRRG